MAAGALLFGRRVAGAAVAAGSPGVVGLPGLDVLPRSTWADGAAPIGPITTEPEVRYLLVHHSVDPGNGYGTRDVAGIIRGFYRFHTTHKGWPDLAYNFMVDRFGRVWEGRAGSLAGPVAGDATGGNQGFDQLCCFVGNHQQAPPSSEAVSAMGRLLGALARRYGIAVGPEATTVFTSRGSNRHPAGTRVTTATIAGHRDMSRTQCPGDLAVARLPELRLLATAAVGVSPPRGDTVPAATTTAATLPPPTTAARPGRARAAEGADVDTPMVVAGGAAAVAAAAAATATAVARRRRIEQTDP